MGEMDPFEYALAWIFWKVLQGVAMLCVTMGMYAGLLAVWCFVRMKIFGYSSCGF